jgi:hypothetical protein
MEFKKVSDNVVDDFHARMADGRIFTDYRSNCILNNMLSSDKNSFDYRYYLINNGKSILDKMEVELENSVKCNSCKTNTVLPVQNVQNCNKGFCTVSEKNANGLGIDRMNTMFQ